MRPVRRGTNTQSTRARATRSGAATRFSFFCFSHQSAAAMSALSVALSTHGLFLLLLDLLSTTRAAGESSLMMWFEERKVPIGRSF